jgi:hypothetical protein
MAKEKAFPKADISYLKSAAASVEADAVVPQDIKYAQSLKNRGVPVPGPLDPEEAFLLLQISKKIKYAAPVPDGFVVYLNDRGVTNIPEDVPTTLFRQQRIAHNKLIGAATDIASKLKR